MMDQAVSGEVLALCKFKTRQSAPGCASLIAECIIWYKKAIRLNPTPPIWYLTSLGAAYRMAGQFEQTIEAYRQAIHRRSDNLVVWQGLATAYILSGREEEARAAEANVIRIDPKFSLDYFSKMLPYKNQTDLECEINALREAGLK